ncbi:dnaJ homolog subfamily C member 25 homolog [Pecten maximus]|uniref:dnaJ homolog subfamily C member 25 homolog n=1 Tax=Pecten maximus TaxID=6579 RepID=UPI001458F240|nr:dnaJ homolog subfamily C member 25 homolog [Pecten maximus]
MAPVISSSIVVFICFFPQALAMIEGLYCGLENCYEILENVDRDSTKTDITKAYRRLARKWHPDMHKTKAKKEEAEQMFTKIANAYEILRDEEQRSDYDYMLDHPDEYLANYYNYYRRRYAPKVDPRIVVVVTISIISIIQYWAAWNNYNTAVTYLSKEPKYRFRAQEIIKQEKLANSTNKKKDRRNKDQIREEEEAMIRKVIEENMDIRGAYQKPTVYDVLWLQIILLPYTLYKYVISCVDWTWRYRIKKEEYDLAAKYYLIRRNLKISQGQFDALQDHEKEDYLLQELWIKEKFVVWKQQKEDEMKIKMAESARYKSYRRYMKKGGPGQMSFGPE